MSKSSDLTENCFSNSRGIINIIIAVHFLMLHTHLKAIYITMNLTYYRSHTFQVALTYRAVTNHLCNFIRVLETDPLPNVILYGFRGKRRGKSHEAKGDLLPHSLYQYFAPLGSHIQNKLPIYTSFWPASFPPQAHPFLLDLLIDFFLSIVLLWEELLEIFTFLLYLKFMW